MKTGDQLLTRRADKIRHIAQLTPLARAVIGLWHMGITDFDRIAAVLGVKKFRRPRLEATMAALRESRHPLIRRWVDYAMPPGVYELLHREATVYCALCKNHVNMVPCPACSTRAIKQ